MELFIITKYFNTITNELYSKQNDELEKIFKKKLTEAGQKRNVYRFYYNYRLKEKLTIRKIEKLKEIMQEINVIEKAYLNIDEKTITLKWGEGI